ncbi:gastrula zinc finger protein XlCGF57.1-like isoform X2 [Zootermopsis nevadensis]|uniref:gastrula zinc finger protein XlCGF57.1-like isoform X2 n=1 Tax=Zootermopsis nevadensis TaxID=136037 RepID=UPI000B8EE68F|nr:gastrula zinc finger protein XlCGF57.1-like isoform X2 [Zootermopsis nevadensis]
MNVVNIKCCENNSVSCINEKYRCFLCSYSVIDRGLGNITASANRMDMMKHEPASGGETLASSSEGNDQLIDMKQETELEVDFAKVTANIDSDIGSMTRVQEDYLVADKQCLDPVSFVKIKIEVKHNMNAIKVEPDLYKTLPVSSLSSNKLVHVKQEEYSAFPNLDWETEHSLNKVKVMDDSNTDSDSVNADSEGKLVDNKPLLDHIEFVAVKAEVTEELCGDTAIKEECKDEVTIEEHDPIPQGAEAYSVGGRVSSSVNSENHHTVKWPLKCNVCAKGFPDSSYFVNHQCIHSVDRLFKCEFCEAGFARNGYLVSHLRTHFGGKRYDCEISKKTFSGSCDKYKIVHCGDKHFNCEICGKGFSLRGNLFKHRRIHTGEKPFKCNICGKEFSLNGNLSRHQRTHTGEKSYECEICGKGFSLRGHLVSHRRTHTGEKPYTCDICGKGFSENSSLVKHKRTHTGEKPFRCEVCDRSFSVSGHLTSHRRAHTGEKPFRCTICKKGFSVPGNLVIHKRRHTGETPFMCAHCGKGFSSRGNLVAHLFTHGDEKRFECEICGKRFSVRKQLVNHIYCHTAD